MEELIELLTDGWIALSEPIKQFLNRKNKVSDRIYHAVKLDSKDESILLNEYKEIFEKIDMSNLSCVIFTPYKLKKHMWDLIIIDKNCKIVNKKHVMFPSSMVEWKANDYIISINN